MRASIKWIITSAVLLPLFILPAHAANCAFSILQHDETPLQGGAPQNLCKLYGGKVVLIVNTASRGKNVNQYGQLQTLYAKYKDQGFVVLAFPSNDFHNETMDVEKIATLTHDKYGVRFPVFKPIHVTGPDTDYLYRDLFLQSGVPPFHDFDKYLIGRSGTVVGYYAAQLSVHTNEFIGQIKQQLALP